MVVHFYVLYGSPISKDPINVSKSFCHINTRSFPLANLHIVTLQKLAKLP